MTTSILFKEYIWLVNTIYQARNITLEEINRKWVLTDMSDGVEIARNTFIRHRNAIENIFGIFIECDEKSRCISAQELMDLGLNFDQCKFPKEEEEVLRPEELLKQYHEKRTALDAKIDAQLREIENMLGITID